LGGLDYQRGSPAFFCFCNSSASRFIIFCLSDCSVTRSSRRRKRSTFWDRMNRSMLAPFMTASRLHAVSTGKGCLSNFDHFSNPAKSFPAKSLTMKLSACSSMERAERKLHPACPDRSCRCRRARRLGRGRQCRAGPRRQRLCARIPGVADSLRRPYPQYFRGRRGNPGAGDRPALARRVELNDVASAMILTFH